jgi:activating signal cointegrator complex subunit 3
MNMQIPRLTSRLRSASGNKQQSENFDDLYRLRAQQLAERRQDQADIAHPTGVAATGARSTLISATLGDWKCGSKPARDAFDAFIYATSKLLGQGEASSSEVTETAAAIWDALSTHPPLSEDAIKRKGLAAAELQRALRALQPVLGSHMTSEAALREFLPAYNALYTWQQQLNPTSGGVTKSLPSHAIHSNSTQKKVVPPVEHHTLSLPWSTEEQAILATCGVSENHPAALLLLSRRDTSPSAPLPTSLERKIDRVPTTATEEVVAAVEAEVFGANKGLGVNQRVGARWLQQWCTTVTFGNSTARTGSESTSNNEDDSVATSVALMLLNSTTSDDALAAELFDLLGEQVFDHIGTLLAQRRSLTTNLRSMVSSLKEAEAADMAASRGGTGPSYGTGVSVMSESEKLMLKAERKAERRKAKQLSSAGGGSGGGFGSDEDAEWLSRYGLATLIEEEIEKEDSAMKIKLGDGMEFRLGEGAGTRGTLPKGTTRKVYKGYEEVHVPAIATAMPPPTEKKVFIEELPEWAQATFEGYTALNRIQSRIFTTAFTSNENMLVCAPTGAGKTNIAMISILREVSQNMVGTSINRNDFKIVYVAPMKALAAEVTASFSKRLAPLGLSVRELTGDMQLSKKEMAETQMIVTTPEKWDVITRKGGEVSVAASVRLLIIDEVHLLNDERGPVIETLVARTTRQVETTQSMIRIVGLSATLPNYKDVATFLGVNHATGLFYFDASYRPVPLQTSFAGVSERNFLARSALMDEICYNKVVEAVKRGHQAMVFVHSRKDTGKTARMLALKAQQNGDTALFDCSEEPSFPHASKDAKKSRNKELQEVFENGIGLHHAGMLRSDRNLMERLFGSGCLKVLCCTATLAWGVNLPAHTVIIKGTQLYNPQKGGFTDLGMLDVQQIFGRAGRPQFQDSGEAMIITTHDKLAHYLGMLTHAVPIESQFIAGLVDHLNAEIVLGTVTNVREAVAWLGYTYLYVRMRQNPLPYAISWEELASDHSLEGHRRKLIHEAARELERAKMARFDERSGNLYVTELGRVASHYYIRQASIEVYNELLKPHMTTEDILSMIAKSSEFENLAVRDEELIELDGLARSACPYDPRGGSENKHGKANILLQAYISRTRMESFSLIADSNYVAQNAPRLARALFEICLRFGWSSAAELCLTVSKCFEHRLWPDQHPLWQFDSVLKYELIRKLEERHFDLEQLRDMSPSDIGAALRHPAAGPQIATAVSAFPTVGIEANLHPITRTVLRIQLTLTPEFSWRDNIHGAALRWLVWVEDSENEKIYHSEMWTLTKKMWKEGAQKISFAVPISEPLPPQYYIRAVSDSWLGSEALLAVSFKGLILPERHPPHTELLDLDPLPVSALGNPTYQSLYTRFSHFNPIQTQAFHTLYHTDENVLLGAPTGSGKTISAELTLLRLFTAHPGAKAVYIAPLKVITYLYLVFICIFRSYYQ